jgi:hypothetical protein
MGKLGTMQYIEPLPNMMCNIFDVIIWLRHTQLFMAVMLPKQGFFHTSSSHLMPESTLAVSKHCMQGLDT